MTDKYSYLDPVSRGMVESAIDFIDSNVVGSFEIESINRSLSASSAIARISITRQEVDRPFLDSDDEPEGFSPEFVTQQMDLTRSTRNAIEIDMEDGDDNTTDR